MLASAVGTGPIDVASSGTISSSVRRSQETVPSADFYLAGWMLGWDPLPRREQHPPLTSLRTHQSDIDTGTRGVTSDRLSL